MPSTQSAAFIVVTSHCSAKPLASPVDKKHCMLRHHHPKSPTLPMSGCGSINDRVCVCAGSPLHHATLHRLRRLVSGWPSPASVDLSPTLPPPFSVHLSLSLALPFLLFHVSLPPSLYLSLSPSVAVSLPLPSGQPL
jgi:uncharacterized protein YceK